jgi:hypothetical protein
MLFYSIFQGMPLITVAYLCNTHSPAKHQEPTANYPTAPFHFSLRIDINIRSLKHNIPPYSRLHVTKAYTEY